MSVSHVYVNIYISILINDGSSGLPPPVENKSESKGDEKQVSLVDLDEMRAAVPLLHLWSDEDVSLLLEARTTRIEELLASSSERGAHGVLLAVLGCLATQGGPIWWASKHRAHHKFCDKPRDPHCPKLRGMIGAFAWFGKVRPPPQARAARPARAMLRPGAWPKHRLEHTLSIPWSLAWSTAHAPCDAPCRIARAWAATLILTLALTLTLTHTLTLTLTQP